MLPAVYITKEQGKFDVDFKNKIFRLYILDFIQNVLKHEVDKQNSFCLFC